MNDDRFHEFRLGQWLVEPRSGVIRGPDGTRRITPKSMEVLLCLAAHPGQVVDRNTFQAEVWDGRTFSDDPLNRCIAELRRKLGDRTVTGEYAGSRDYIETIPKRGYLLVAEVTPVEETEPAGQAGGLIRTVSVVTLAVLAAITATSLWWLWDDFNPGGDLKIAVLPFANLSDSGQQYFADGMHEELIGELSRAGALSVRSRTSTQRYRDRQQSLLDIARELGVDVIVDGTVSHDGDTVRVTAQLIEAESDENLWADSIEKSLSVAGLFAIQSEIAQEITNALQITLGGDIEAPAGPLPTDNMQAYDAFMLGKFHYRRQLPGDIRESVQRFESAVELDPEFAEAWDWLAYAYNHAATGVGHLEPREAYPKARVAALRALELEPDLATAQSILGYIRAVYDRDWVGAVADLERALELDPNDSGTVWSLAHVYSMLGRYAEGVQLTLDFAERFPAEGRNRLEVASRLLDAGRYAEALLQIDLAESHGAEPAMIADARGIIFVSLGRLGEASKHLEIAVEARQRDANTVGRLAWVYAQLERRSDAEALLAELTQRAETERVPRLALATAYAGLGDAQGAMDELWRVAETGGREVIGVAADPFFAELHEHPDFVALVASLRLPAR